ncbi:MAG: hypothetical protein IH898_12955 [Planctomycetes bacterium]|nr:hypothetical protein [Planctomycetota bacterium]
MRPLVLLTLIAALLGANTAQARLFWQTYGSVVPADDCGSSCTWNWNQDYFVPRHCSSCRYGLLSPCKTSCTTSPACNWRHPLYPGYCGIYGPCHYGRRDHVYDCHCGCGPVRPSYGPWRHGCHPRHGCRPACGGCATSGCYLPVLRPDGMLPNVERSKFQVLGSLPIPGDELLASLDMGAAANANADANANDEALPGVLLPRVTPVEPTLPSLGLPPTESLTQ